MPTIVIGNTSKRINSTSQTFSGTSCSCLLKDPCSMQRPVFRVQGLTKGNLYNYCSFEGRYYWVDDIVYETNNIQDVYCHLDPLATYKSAILGTKGLVAYGDSTHWNQYVDDTRFFPEVKTTCFNKEAAIFPFDPSSQGCIVMTFAQTTSVDWISNMSSTDYGGGITPCGLHVAILTVSDFKACIGDLTHFGDTVPSDPTLITSIGEACLEIVQAFARSMESSGGGSFMDNIKRCIWLPFSFSDLVSKCGGAIRYGMMIGGMLASNVNWYEIPTNQVYHASGSFDITSNINAFTDHLPFLRNNRFMGLQLNTPGGCAAIPNDVLLDPSNSNLTYYLRSAISVQDGSWACRISNDSTHKDTFQMFTGNVGIDLMGSIYSGPTTSTRVGEAIVQLEKGAIQMGIGNILGFSGDSGAGAGNGVQAQSGLMSIVSGITGAFTACPHNCTVTTSDYGGSSAAMFTSGSQGSNDSASKTFLTINLWKPKCIADSKDFYINYCNQYGYPVNKYLTLGDISGYCQCIGASVQGATGASEAAKSTINSYINTGIYIE